MRKTPGRRGASEDGADPGSSDPRGWRRGRALASARLFARLASGVAVLGAALALAVPPAAGLQTPAPPLKDADYFKFADTVIAQLEPTYSETRGFYATGANFDTIYNASFLTVFATAALRGHAGPARNDARARHLVQRLLRDSPYFRGAAPPRKDKMFHTPGWMWGMDRKYSGMDKAVDPKVAEALQLAYRARGTLGLDQQTVNAIRTQISAVAHTKFFRYPLVRLNQINWPAELYAAEWTVNRDPELLRRDYRQHVTAFTRGFRKPQIRRGSTNVGPSYRFIYQSNEPIDNARNVDSTEYATITQHFMRWYELARAAGMRRLPGDVVRLLRAWNQRALYGYWTHAGFFSWDTGWGYERWMKGKTWAYGMQGLLAVASAPTFNLRRSEAGYAKYLFDRGLQLYERLGERPGGRPFLPDAKLFGISRQGVPAERMMWARMAANATRAVVTGMGSMRAIEPPPFYAYDADIGRLSVSTPRYATAIMATGRGKVPYGGVELARLFDAEGDPLGGTGGMGRNAFGASVTARGGRTVLRTQTARISMPSRPPLTLTRSPRGRVTKQRRLASRPDAGPFRRLGVSALSGGGGVRVRSTYNFSRNAIGARWQFARTRAGSYRGRVQFPVWGTEGTITARLRGGSSVPIKAGGRTLSLAKVTSVKLRGSHGSYVIRPCGGRGRLGANMGARQRSNPRGGPVLWLSPPAIKRTRRALSVLLIPSAAGGLDQGG